MASNSTRYTRTYNRFNREIDEWSRFMGYKVDPLDIALLKVQLAHMLKREGSLKPAAPYTKMEGHE